MEEGKDVLINNDIVALLALLLKGGLLLLSCCKTGQEFEPSSFKLERVIDKAKYAGVCLKIKPAGQLAIKVSIDR